MFFFQFYNFIFVKIFKSTASTAVCVCGCCCDSPIYLNAWCIEKLWVDKSNKNDLRVTA